MPRLFFVWALGDFPVAEDERSLARSGFALEGALDHAVVGGDGLPEAVGDAAGVLEEAAALLSAVAAARIHEPGMVST